MPFFPIQLSGATRHYCVYSDESCISGHRFMLISGVSCREADVKWIGQEIDSIKSNCRFPSDSLQWKNISHKDKAPTYRRLVDLIVELNSEHILDYTCLVIDTRKLDHKRFNDGDGEIGFLKEVYRLYMAIIRLYEPLCLRAFHGQRDSKFELDQTKNIVNSGASKDFDTYNYRPLHTLEYRDVSKDPMLQINDVLLGCTAYYWNAGMRRNPNSIKAEIAEYMHSECCAYTLGKPTPWNKPHFNIWQVKLENREPR